MHSRCSSHICPTFCLNIFVLKCDCFKEINGVSCCFSSASSLGERRTELKQTVNQRFPAKLYSVVEAGLILLLRFPCGNLLPLLTRLPLDTTELARFDERGEYIHNDTTPQQRGDIRNVIGW